MRMGTVKWFSDDKGYGYIELEGCGDVLVHFTALQKSGFRILNEGQQIAFDVEETEQGPQAINLSDNLTKEQDSESGSDVSRD